MKDHVMRRNAPPTPPLTGASTISSPRCRAAAMRRREAVGSMVLLSTMRVPFLLMEDRFVRRGKKTRAGG